jgi:DNA polymerase I
VQDVHVHGIAGRGCVLHKAHGRFALPSKGTVEAGEEFEGGAVFEPISGVKEMVSVLDLKCFSGDTAVMTPDGSRNITELSVGDEVYTLNPETFECEVKPVAETHQYENQFGELHHLSGNTHDFKVTENHRFLVSKTRGRDEQTPDDFEFCEYRDMPEYDRFAFPQHEPMAGRRPERFEFVDEVEGGNIVVYTDEDTRTFRNRMPEAVVDELDLARGSAETRGLTQKVGKYLIPLSVYRANREVIDEHADDVFLKYGRGHRETPLSFEMDDWLALLGWFVTEGSLDGRNRRITLHQQDETGRESIQTLLDRMEINYNVDQQGVNVSNRYLFDWLEANCGDGYANKRLPEWVFDLDASLLETLLETMIQGDGSRADSGLGKFWTKSEQLRDAVADIAIRCGHKPTVTEQADGTCYVSVGKRGSFHKGTNAEVESHDGDVYCVTAEDNHVVLAGRNGNFQWVGQSLYPMCMVTINASPETIVDPEEYDGETYRAPNGQHFRADPPGMMRDMIDELLTEREEKKSLRNQHDPGSEAYERYDRQQAAVKVIMNCFTPDTEVLTPNGVRNIRDLDVGDEVYSIEPDTLEMEVKPVVETQEYPDYEGKLVDIETDKIDFRVTPNHRMLVRKDETNGISWAEDDYRFVEAGNLDRATNYQLPHDWSMTHGEPIETVDLTELVDEDYEVWVRPDVHGHTFAAEIGYYPDKVLKTDVGEEGYVFDPDAFAEHREYIETVCERSYVHRESGRKWIPRTYDGDDFLELLAWYITEGAVYTSEEKHFGEKLRGSATTIQLAQDAPVIADGGESDYAAIGDLLDRMGFDYDVDGKGYQFTSRLLGNFLEASCGATSEEKRIPEMVFDASREQKRRFLETLIAGDGDWQQNSWRYSTNSERLRDDVLRLCVHLGVTAHYNEDCETWRMYGSEDAKNMLRMHRSASRSRAQNGVYCVTVADNHTLLAGRNGRFQFVGQSLYGVSGWDRFRLYDKENAAAVTATGREVIKFTEETAKELEKEVTYGDTDSVMLELEDVWDADVSDVEVPEKRRESHPEMDETALKRLQYAIDSSYELEEFINDAYDEFAREELDAEDHRFQIEFEKLYRRFFQAGKKKRYAGHIVWKEGKDVDDIDITGFEYQRSDIAPITKEVQREVIEKIVTGDPTEEVKTYLHEVIENFQSGNVDLDDIGIPGGIGKRLDNYDTDTAQVRGAKYANLMLGTNFQRGSKPKRLYLKRVHDDFFQRVEDEEGLDPSTDPLYGEFRREQDVICFEYADQIPAEFEIDYEKMLDKTLKGPIARILEALDVSWEEVKSGQEQTGLGQYM